MVRPRPWRERLPLPRKGISQIRRGAPDIKHVQTAKEEGENFQKSLKPKNVSTFILNNYKKPNAYFYAMYVVIEAFIIATTSKRFDAFFSQIFE